MQDVNLRLLAIQFIGLFTLFAVALFMGAGTIFWLSGWLFLLLFFGFLVILTAWLSKHNPALLQERMTGLGKDNRPRWDKVFFAGLQLMFLAWLSFMPLDAVRFHWSHVPLWLRVSGAALLIVSFYLLFLVFRENSYLSPAVRLQADRGQTVVSTGPYRYVRHPMYAAVILFVIGPSFLLGSWYGLLPGLLLISGMAYRALREEQVLKAGLPGYEAYMAKVKYRFVPHLW